MREVELKSEINVRLLTFVGQAMLQQRALFHPRGLFGLLYWYAVAPLHHMVFRGMLLGIRQEALKIAAAAERSAEGDVTKHI